MTDRRTAAPGSPPGKTRFDRFVLGRPPEPEPTVERYDGQDVSGGANLRNFRHLPERARLGICCSGGGIRSASFSLGALQRLREEGLFQEADYLASVSGGGYMTIGLATMLKLTAQERMRSSLSDEGGSRDLFDELPPWAPLSPEESHLRDHSSYLAPGLWGKMWFAFYLVVALVGNILPFAGLMVLLGIGEGALAHAAQESRGLSFPGGWLIRLVFVVGGIGFLIAILRVFVGKLRNSQGWFTALWSLATKAITISVLAAILLLAIPKLLQYMALHPRSLHPQALSFVSLFSTATTLYGVYKANRGLSNKVIHAVLKILTVVAAPLTLLLPFLYLAYSTDDYLNKQCSSASCLGTSWVAIAVGSAIAVIVVAYLTTPKVPSMHTFYRERLSTAFVARRSSKGSEVLLTQPAYREAIGLSDMEDVKAPDGNPIQRAHGERGPLPDSRMPRLVVCAAVNLSGDVVPPGRAAGSFTFESQESGGPLTGYVPTSVLEGASGHGVITLPAAMAISGAAVSPSMGRMTMAWLRPFLALFNVRLGVWLRNPLALPGVTDAAGHPLAQASAEEPTPDGPFKRPGLWYLLREMLGFNGLRSRYVYVTDGGHWENLGLVELIRRGCGQILCIDASGDKPDTFNTLGQALALARTELGVDVDIDVGGMAPARDTEMSETTHVQGTIRYPNGVKGTLIYMRTAITPKSPLDLQAYAKADPRFPHHSTADQLFTDQQLESYRGLGRAAAGDAAACLKQARVTIG